MQLQLRGITKHFGSLAANQGVDLSVGPGEIHALLGENGAGKTTLMNVLFGLYDPDDGEILLDGKPVAFSSPKGAIAAGIGMVHQHFALVPVFSVAENVILGDEPVGFAGWLKRNKARQEIRELSRSYGFEVDPDATVRDLPVGLQQRTEILKALLREAQVLILDEPTAVLTPQEIRDLFLIMRRLSEAGRSMLFITHKLKEVMEIADRITIMRAGRVVATTTPAETSEEELASMMVGRAVSFRVPKKPNEPGTVVLDVEGLAVRDERGNQAVRNLSLQVRSGEILAIAGVQGNGQSELVRALMGLVVPDAGTISVGGVDLTGATPKQIVESGVGYVPEDRQREALILSFSIAENLVIDVFDHPPYSSGIRLDRGAIERSAKERIAEFDIRTQSPSLPAENLSGGNQQKVVLARELSRPLKLLIAAQPTRGLDVGSIETVHRRLVEQRDQGTAVLVVSSELDEVLALGDRIAVMFNGEISGYATPETPIEDIGLLMAGSARQTEVTP